MLRSQTFSCHTLCRIRDRTNLPCLMMRMTHRLRTPTRPPTIGWANLKKWQQNWEGPSMMWHRSPLTMSRLWSLEKAGNMVRKQLDTACFLGPPVALSLSTRLGQVAQVLLYENAWLQQCLRWWYSIQVLLYKLFFNSYLVLDLKMRLDLNMSLRWHILQARLAEESRQAAELLEERLAEEKWQADARLQQALASQTSQCFDMFAVSSLIAKHM